MNGQEVNKENIITNKEKQLRNEEWNWKENLKGYRDQIMLIRWQAKYGT